MEKSETTVKKNDLLQRSITGALFALVVTGCIYGGYESVIIMFGVLHILAMHEYLSLTNKISGNSRYHFLILGLLVLPLTAAVAESFIRYPDEWQTMYLLLLTLLLMTVFVFMPRSENTFLRLGLSASGLIFVSLPFYLAIVYTVMSNIFQPYDWKVLFSVISIVWMNDTMAYATGRLWGKNKLAPHISPGKTIEGFVGGILFAAVLGFAWGKIMHADAWMWCLAGLLIGISATVGDLAESMLKRNAGVKDSGSLFPGHGGVLDRFDGFMAAIIMVSFLKMIHII